MDLTLIHSWISPHKSRPFVLNVVQVTTWTHQPTSHLWGSWPMFRKLINLSWLLRSMLSDKVRPLHLRISEHILIACIDTALAYYKQRNKVGHFASPAQPPESPPQFSILISFQCQVRSSEAGLNKWGTVWFFAKIKFAKDDSVGVGIEYDESMGKNDRS